MSSADAGPSVPPGLVPVPQWRPQSEIEARTPSNLWGGVARKP